MQTESWIPEPNASVEGNSPSCCVGQLVGLTDGGQPLVDFPGNENGVMKARALAGLAFGSGVDSRAGIAVLLAFDNGNLAKPIIIGEVNDTVTALAKKPRSVDAVIDGRKVVLHAEQEITLQSGKSSITLSKDGRIILKGISIVSRASGANKIRGGSVSIN
jgi:hypothetical protein